MGLLYPFPVSLDETEFATKENQTLTLKTYGLPYIFWIYALCSVAVIFFMFLAIKAPVLKLVQLGDETDALLGHSLLGFIGSLPVLIFSFFFYEKRLVATRGKIVVEHRVFSLKMLSYGVEVSANDEIIIEAFLDSPNVARARNNPEDLGFQNKGYFVLFVKSSDAKKFQLDRHSRKADLEKIKGLLESVVRA